ncbi:MAG: hypothetical protein AB7S41_05245 [Parvibaculaceae bacterium]
MRPLLLLPAGLAALLLCALPARGNGETPPLRGSLAEPAETEYVIGFGLSYSSNAGPTLEGKGSPGVDLTFGFSHASRRGPLEISATGNFFTRRFFENPEASKTNFAFEGSVARGFTDRRVTLTASSIRSSEIDEDVWETGLKLEHAWTQPVWSPFVSLASYYLRYDNIASDLFEFAHQGDRNRFSHALELGVTRDFGNGLQLRGGFGIDGKTYLHDRDDFGLRRNNVSAYPFLALSYATTRFDLTAAYSPVWRSFEDPVFDRLFAHVYALQGEFRPLTGLRFFAGVSSGLQETDFLLSRAIEARIVNLGLGLSFEDRSGVTLQGILTRERHRGLPRVDDKLEIKLNGRARLTKRLFLTLDLSYLDFRSTLGVRTEEIAGGLGIACQI